MANGDIKQRIVLEGEKEYSSAIKDAQRNLKTLRSELKAETAELGKNATAQQKNETKAKSLKAQIAEQEKVVKACRDALEEVKTKYADNEDAIAKYEQKLNDARTTLANMNNQLEETGETFETIESGANSAAVENYALAESFENIASVASSVSGTIESIFTGIVSTVKDAVSAIWGEVMEIAAKADNYLDLASFLGADATDVQQWDRALKATGNDMSTITSMITKLKYGGKNKEVAEWFGISGENYTNDLEYIQDVIQQMYKYKDSMKDAGTWDTAMSEIFGAKKVQDVDEILSDWTDILTDLSDFDVENGGVGLTEDELQTMGDLYNQVGLLQEKWNAFKESVTTKLFGKLSLELTGTAKGALDALIAFMNAGSEEEAQKALDDLEKNIEEAFEKIAAAFENGIAKLEEVAKKLQESDNSVVKAIGAILQSVVDALKWLSEEGNIQKVIDGLKLLAECWAVAKLVEFANSMASLATNIGTIGTKLFGSAAAGSAGTAATGSTAGILSSIATLGYVAVGVMMIAPTVAKLLRGETEEDKEIREGIDTLTEDSSAESRNEMMNKKNISTQDLLKFGFTGNREYLEDEPVSSSGNVDSWGFVPTRRTPNGTVTGYDMTAEQWSAIQDLWDAMRSFSWGTMDTGDYYAAMESTGAAFEGNEDTYDKLLGLIEEMKEHYGMDWETVEDLPATWWTNQGVNTDENNLINSLPGKIGAEIQNGMSGIKVVMDGETVGYLVAPYVSQEIAKTIY